MTKRILFVSTIAFLGLSAVVLTAVDALGIDNTAPSVQERVTELNGIINQQDLIILEAVPYIKASEEAKKVKAKAEEEKGKVVHGFKQEPTPHETVETIFPTSGKWSTDSPNISVWQEPMKEVKLEATVNRNQDLVDACNKHAKNPSTCYNVMTGIFTADSSFCTKGAGKTHNNCGNVRPGSGQYGDPDVQWTAVNNWRHYENIRDGIHDNTAIYAQLYEGKGWWYLKEGWADGSDNWLRIVQSKM